jgi:putative ABC transport system permease protein
MTFTRFIRICGQRLQSLFRKQQLDDELDQELLFHLEQLERENLEAGMSPAEARREARKGLGNLAVFKEECRDERRVSWFYDFCQDARYGVRMMRKHPGFTSVAAISLALGIGGNTAILNVGGAVLWNDLPLPDPGRVMVIHSFPSPTPYMGGPVTIPEYVAWKTRNRTFESMGASISNRQDLAGDEVGGAPEHLFGQAVTPSLFDVLKVQPHLGRLFLEEEAQIGMTAPVIILSHRLWQRRFAADSKIIGKEIRMNGRNLKVIGVMPPGFWYPNKDTEFWIPFAPTRFQLEGSGRLYLAAGRLKAGITVEQAQADMAGISSQIAQHFPDRRREWTTVVLPLREHWFGWIRRPLLLLEGAVILVLLIACANVSSLLLARMPARRPEITIRLLLGAGRGRIVRQFLTESLLLSLIGGALGVLIAWWGVNSLETVQPPVGRIPISGLGQNTGILVSAALLSIVSSLLFGFVPALVAFSSGIDAKQAAAHRRRGSLSGILVSAQICLALVLLVSSGLLTNSFVRLVLDERGFDPRDILTFEYRIPVQDYARRSGSYRGMPTMEIEPPTPAIQRVHEKLKALPEAESVAGASTRPVNGVLSPTAIVNVEGRPVATDVADRENKRVFYFLVTDNFFETMKTPVLRGRDFAAGDTRSTPWVAVINETMARRFWPGESPIGKRFTVDAATGELPREVIGVVRDVALQYIRIGPPQAVAYTLYVQQPERYEGFNANMFGQMTFFVRSRQEPSSLASAARRAVAEVDPDRPISNIQTMTDFLGDGIRTRRYYALTFGVFAFMATVLAAVGVYGVMSSSVSQRTREIGIHMAMGARARDIVRLVGGRALVLVVMGLLSGFVASLVLTHWLEAHLWGVTSTDPATFTVVIVLLTVVASAACFIPARRAMRVDPTEALRMD